jgi:5-methylthioadenosine/S-adenosylhomocysteine deaminase
MRGVDDANMHVHVSETADEVAGCGERHGKSPVTYFADLGLFDGQTTAAHCVHLSDDDIAILREKGVTVASCPVSNLKLGSGVARLSDLDQAGVRVTLGTDGPASNNSLSMLNEMKNALILQRGIYRDFSGITPAKMLDAATRQGFLAQGRGGCGEIAVGKAADLVMIDLSAPNLNPDYNLLNNLLFSANEANILLTMIDGQVVYDRGEYPTIDLERAKAEARSAMRKIAARVV